jgi:hypothetical protein
MPENNKNKDIELRSEKVRNIVGKVPPLLLRVGIFIISLVIMLVLALAYFIPYPEYEDIIVNLYSDTPVQIKQSSSLGFFHTEFLDRHVNKEEETGVLLLDSDSHTNIPTYADISGYVYYQLDSQARVRKGDILYAIIPDSISEVYGVCLIPCDEIGRISKGQEVSVNIEDRKRIFDKEISLIKGQVCKIYPIIELDTVNGKTFYKVEISGFPDS